MVIDEGVNRRREENLSNLQYTKFVEESRNKFNYQAQGSGQDQVNSKSVKSHAHHHPTTDNFSNDPKTITV